MLLEVISLKLYCFFGFQFIFVLVNCCHLNLFLLCFLIFEICVNSLYAFSALFVGFKTSFNSINTMMNSLKILNCGPKALFWIWILQKENEIKQSASSFI